MLALRTSGTDFGYLLPTPSASDPQLERRAKHGEHYQTKTGTVRRINVDGTSSNLGLAASAVKWPTPQASDNRPRGTQNSTARRMAIGKQVGLEAMVKFATPTVQDSKNNGAASQMKRNSLPLNAQIGGGLNPNWVEWLMGWPIGHTDLKQSATAKSPNARPLPSDTYPQPLSEQEQAA